MYYCALSLGVLQHNSPDFLSLVRFGVFWSAVSVNFLLNNIDMALLRTSYMYGGFLEYYFRLQCSAFWSVHDKTRE